MSEFNRAAYEKTDKRRKYDNKIKRREAARQYVWDYLSTHPCVDCGESDPKVLEFDHVRGEKTQAVSVLANGNYSLDRVIEEIKRCDVRCANCHRRKTYDDQGWFSGW
jgi:hypothetical protein